ICYCDDEFYQARLRENLEIFDRIGGGDSFASGLIYGFLTDRGPQAAVEYGAAHGALAMTTPGDTSMATLAEGERGMKGGGARGARGKGADRGARIEDRTDEAIFDPRSSSFVYSSSSSRPRSERS